MYSFGRYKENTVRTCDCSSSRSEKVHPGLRRSHRLASSEPRAGGGTSAEQKHKLKKKKIQPIQSIFTSEPRGCCGHRLTSRRYLSLSSSLQPMRCPRSQSAALLTVFPWFCSSTRASNRPWYRSGSVAPATSGGVRWPLLASGWSGSLSMLFFPIK